MSKPNAENSHLLSIRNRILIFAVLVTVVPSLAMGLLLQNMLQSTIEEKVEQKFIDSAQIMEREISLWVKERVYDLNVFSNSSIVSDVVTDYLKRMEEGKNQTQDPASGIGMIHTYLTTLQNQFEDYVRIFILSRQGSIIASSGTGGREPPFPFPEDSVEQISDKQWFKSDVYIDPRDKSPLILIGVPLSLDPLYEYGALLVMETRVTGLRPLLDPAELGASGDSTYGSLVDMKTEQAFLYGRKARKGLKGINLALAGELQNLREFTGPMDERLMGMVVPFHELGWGLFIAEDYKTAFSRVIRSRHRNILIVCFFGVLMGIAAYLLTRQIMVPLSDLTRGAKRVAGGDLDVQLMVHRNDEIGFATSVFNEMVAELKQNQTKLEQLATTDPLTGLNNRKQVMTLLRNQYEYYRRYKTGFSVLMLDVDHFKAINDTHGHQAGDTVLKQVALIFQENLRNVDSAGRYGGEEFLVILAESAKDEAIQAAERIRESVENHIFVHEEQKIRLNISIGIARIHEQDGDEQRVVKRADMALYRAKGEGRNRVVYLASEDQTAGGDEKGADIQ
ncbi:sensor domain-containing diguanylate cyclase [Desulfospira joergensenii]|uniref:sensor domain-containing diguanylate cyclase n=1 Tax=Desulfospira joergensenii TaxID=53329 RepID=UPI0003B3CFBF|nr:sensor domain-containing diguanylate cyclase [Desulfospira joergensenii]